MQRLKAARLLGTHTQEEWIALCESVSYRCVKCGGYTLALTKDHIVFLYLGGSDAIENIQPLCRRCNSSRSPLDSVHNYLALYQNFPNNNAQCEFAL